MGLGDLFSKEGREKRALEKNLKGAIAKYGQSADRMACLEALAKDGSDEALFGLLRRFALQYDKSIEDEQEKDWVFETLVAKGAGALGPVKRYLLSAESISWPLRILSKIAASKDEELAVCKTIIEKHEPGYERDPSKKVQLLGHLGSMKHAEAAALCSPYLEDMDETVRYAAVEALVHQKDEAAARGPLLALFASDKEESLRIRLRIAEGFVELGWSAQDLREAVEKKLPDAFVLDKQGKFVKKTGGAS